MSSERNVSTRLRLEGSGAAARGRAGPRARSAGTACSGAGVGSRREPGARRDTAGSPTPSRARPTAWRGPRRASRARGTNGRGCALIGTQWARRNRVALDGPTRTGRNRGAIGIKRIGERTRVGSRRQRNSGRLGRGGVEPRHKRRADSDEAKSGRHRNAASRRADSSGSAPMALSGPTRTRRIMVAPGGR